MWKFVFGAVYMLGACLTFNSAMSFQDRCRNQDGSHTFRASVMSAMWPVSVVMVGTAVVALDIHPECRRSNEKVT